MGIRVATQADIPRILELGELMHAESPRWSRLSFNRVKAEHYLRDLIDGAGAVFLAEHGGVVVGGIAGVLSSHWSSDDLLADEVAFFMAPAARGNMLAVRLVCTLRAWAEQRGAKWLQAGTSTGLDPERTAQLYERLGFTRCAIGLEAAYEN